VALLPLTQSKKVSRLSIFLCADFAPFSARRSFGEGEAVKFFSHTTLVLTTKKTPLPYLKKTTASTGKINALN
jgi:hypothetical protein